MDIKRKELWLLRLIYLAGIICAVIFVLIRIRGGAELIVNKQIYFNARDLYKHSYIDHFKEPHPAFDRPIRGRITPFRETSANRSIDEADILIFGDSFMDFRWLPSFPELFGERTGLKVHFNKDYFPLHVLKASGYTGSVRRVLIYEIGEKGIGKGFMKPTMNLMVKSRNPSNRPFYEILKPGEAERRYSALLQMSLPTYWIYQKQATLKFDLLRYISPLTPVYSLDPPALFFASTADDSPSSFFYEHSEEQISIICDNLERLKNQLDDLYNIEMIFLPVPNKISIHHEWVYDNASYNQLIPRLGTELARRGIRMIDLYEPYRSSSDVLYFYSDTHWNEAGIDLALKTTIDYLAAHNLLP